jgi:hypothetical protein
MEKYRYYCNNIQIATKSFFDYPEGGVSWQKKLLFFWLRVLKKSKR